MSEPEPFAVSGAEPPGGSSNAKSLLFLGAGLVLLGAIGAGAWFLLSGDDDEAATTATTVFQTEIGGGDSPTTTVAGSGDTDAPATSSAPAADGKGTVDNPYAVGEPIDVRYEDLDSGQERVWSIEVLEPLSNITNAVAEENQFNDPPPDDAQFMGAPVRVTYVSGPAPASMFELSFKAVGPSGVVVATFDPSCGVIPNALDTFAELFEGGVVEGNLCWTVSDADQDDLTMIVEVFFSDETAYAELNG